MKAIIVYESQWGNTAAVARAIAEGMGPAARVMTTDQATGDVLDGIDLIVAGAPILGFSLPTAQMVAGLPNNPGSPPAAPDASHQSMRTWLNSLPAGTARTAAFETRIWWSPGSAAKAILKSLAASGYSVAAAPQKFIVTGKYGPLKDGELDRARAWGKLLASL
jgi:hypothetical protein